MKSTQPSLISSPIMKPISTKDGMKGRRTYQEQCIYSKPLNGAEKLLNLKFRKIDNLIASIGGRMTDHDQSVNMALWQ